jgi:hypothetical protein
MRCDGVGQRYPGLGAQCNVIVQLDLSNVSGAHAQRGTSRLLLITMFGRCGAFPGRVLHNFCICQDIQLWLFRIVARGSLVRRAQGRRIYYSTSSRGSSL